MLPCLPSNAGYSGGLFGSYRPRPRSPRSADIYIPYIMWFSLPYIPILKPESRQPDILKAKPETRYPNKNHFYPDKTRYKITHARQPPLMLLILSMLETYRNESIYLCTISIEYIKIRYTGATPATYKNGENI